jgi:ACS family glucarate transporter-like MFS transporter
MPNNKPTFVRWRVMSILVLASFVSYTLRYNFSAAAPAMIKDLGLTEIQWGWTVAAFLTSYAFFQLPGGLLGDRFGPRRVITIIAVLWALLTALTALVPGADSASVIVIMASLMLVRILAGSNGLSSMGLNLGIAASTPVMAWLIVEFGWRVTFLFVAPLGLALAALWWWYGRDTPAEHSAVNEAEIQLIRRGRSMDASADVRPESIGLLQLLKNRDVFWLTFSYFCIQYTFYVVLSWFFYFLVEIREFSMAEAGWLTSGQFIAGAAGATLSGWYCDRLCRRLGLSWGCRLPLIIGGVGSALCLLGGIYYPGQAVAVGLLIACIFFGQTTEAPYWTISMAIGGKHSGAVGGAMNTGGNAVGIFSAVLVPWTASTFGWSFAIALAAILSLIASAMILLVNPDRKIDQ